MIRYFPMPYPDESMYSVLAKYDNKSGNNNYFKTAKDLFGYKRSIITYSFVNGLDYLCEQLNDKLIYNQNYFINSYMVLPFYKAFIRADRYSSAYNNLKNGTLPSVMTGIGMTAKSIGKENGFKFCPQCIVEDRKKYNVAYA